MNDEIKEIYKLRATLKCIKDSETILSGEYFIIHSDFIIALDEEIEQLSYYISNLHIEEDLLNILKGEQNE